MFSWYHKNFKKYERWIFLAILGIIVISFAASGVSSEMSSVLEGKGKDNKDLAIESPAMNISRADFDELMYRWDRAVLDRGTLFTEFFQQYGMSRLYQGEDMFRLYVGLNRGGDPSAKRQVAVDVCVILTAAKDADIRTTQTEVAQRIKDLFGRVGGYDFERYTAFLQNVGMDAEAYEKSVEEFLTVGKYLDLLQSAVSVSPEDVLNEYMRTGSRAKAKYAFFDGLGFIDQTRKRLSQRDVADFMNQSKNLFGYRREEQGRIEFLVARYDTLKAAIPDPSADEIKAYYDAHKEELKRPVYGPDLPGADDHDHDHDGTPDKPGEAKPDQPAPLPDPYKTVEEAKTEIIAALKLEKARDQASETMKGVQKRLWDKLMAGDARPEFAPLAAEFKMEVGTTAWYDEAETTSVDTQLGSPEASNPPWGSLLKDDPKTARWIEVRTDKGHVLARLVAKRDAETYLPTPMVRRKATDQLARRNSGLTARKEADALQTEFKKRFDAAYAAKIKEGKQLSDEELAALRIDVFTTVALEKKVTLKETELITKDDQIPGVPDTRPFVTELFNIEAKGDSRVVYGNSGSYVAELIEKRPPSAAQFQQKRGRIESMLLTDKRGKFMAEMLAGYKKEKCKINIDTAPPSASGMPE